MPIYGQNVCDLEFNCISTPSLIPKAKQCTSQKKDLTISFMKKIPLTERWLSG